MMQNMHHALHVLYAPVYRAYPERAVDYKCNVDFQLNL